MHQTARSLTVINMKFDILGRIVLGIVRSHDQWLAFYSGNDGLKHKTDDIRIPASLSESELDAYIADVFHEWATPERNEVRRL